MTNMTQLPRLTMSGLRAAYALVERMRYVDDPMERRGPADEILASAELSAPVPGSTLIDKSARFQNLLEYAGTIHRATAHMGNLGLMDVGVNAALTLVYIDQVIPAKARKPDAYFVGNVFSPRVRNYRNTQYVALSVYERHLRNPGGLPTTLLLNCPVDRMSGTLEKIGQDQDVLRSAGTLDLLSLGFITPKGKYVILPPGERGGAVISSKEAVRELFVLLTQASKNYDITNMTAAQIVALIPDTPTLLPYKKRIKKALAARAREEKIAP